MTDYKVGYKKPPSSTKFKPGVSGNPKGRQKGRRNLKTDLLDELNQSVVIKENGKSKKLSMQRLMIKQLCTRFIKGDMASGKLLATFMLKLLSDEQDAETSHEEEVLPQDKEILDYYFNNRETDNEKQ